MHFFILLRNAFRFSLSVQRASMGGLILWKRWQRLKFLEEWELGHYSISFPLCLYYLSFHSSLHCKIVRCCYAGWNLMEWELATLYGTATLFVGMDVQKQGFPWWASVWGFIHHLCYVSRQCSFYCLKFQSNWDELISQHIFHLLVFFTVILFWVFQSSDYNKFSFSTVLQVGRTDGHRGLACRRMLVLNQE